MAEEFKIESLPPDFIIPNHPGRKAQGQTWSDIINRVTDMTAAEVASYFGKLANSDQYPQGLTLKEIMVARAVEDFLEKPNSAIWSTIMDRAEGRVAETVNVKQITDVEISIKRKVETDDDSGPGLIDSGKVIRESVGDSKEETGRLLGDGGPVR